MPEATTTKKTEFVTLNDPAKAKEALAGLNKEYPAVQIGALIADNPAANAAWNAVVQAGAVRYAVVTEGGQKKTFFDIAHFASTAAQSSNAQAKVVGGLMSGQFKPPAANQPHTMLETENLPEAATATANTGMVAGIMGGVGGLLGLLLGDTLGIGALGGAALFGGASAAATGFIPAVTAMVANLLGSLIPSMKPAATVQAAPENTVVVAVKGTEKPVTAPGVKVDAAMSTENITKLGFRGDEIKGATLHEIKNFTVNVKASSVSGSPEATKANPVLVIKDKKIIGVAFNGTEGLSGAINLNLNPRQSASEAKYMMPFEHPIPMDELKPDAELPQAISDKIKAEIVKAGGVKVASAASPSPTSGFASLGTLPPQNFGQGAGQGSAVGL